MSNLRKKNRHPCEIRIHAHISEMFEDMLKTLASAYLELQHLGFEQRKKLRIFLWLPFSLAETGYLSTTNLPVQLKL